MEYHSVRLPENEKFQVSCTILDDWIAGLFCEEAEHVLANRHLGKHLSTSAANPLQHPRSKTENNCHPEEKYINVRQRADDIDAPLIQRTDGTNSLPTHNGENLGHECRNPYGGACSSLLDDDLISWIHGNVGLDIHDLSYAAGISHANQSGFKHSMNKHNPITLDCLDEHTHANDSFSCDSVITKVHFEGAVDVADQVADTDPVQNIMSTKSHDDVMIAIQEDVYSTGSGDGDDLVFSTSGEDTKLRFSKRKANCIGNSASQNKRFMLKDSESKRSRAAEVHNRSERRRRERINEKLKILRDLIPHTDKTDKATLLEEAIEYLKALQAQIMVMSCMTGICVPPMLVTNGMVECFIPQDMVVEYRAGLVPNGAMISHLQSEQHVL